MKFAPPPANDFVVEVTDAKLAFFAENGYAVFEQVTTAEELAWLREVYDELIAAPRSGFLDTVFDVARPYGSKAPPALGQLLFPERLVPEIRDTAMWRNANRIATRLLDLEPSKVEHWGHILFKTANGDNETPWHQDEAYWDVNLRYHAVGAWMPLDDVDVDNGCLWFVPGSHKAEVLPHRHLGDDPAVHVLELTIDAATGTAVPVPLAAGGMSFHHPRTLHYARANSSNRIRRAWANEFQSAPIEREQPADHPWVIAGRQALAESLGRRT